MLNLFAGAAFLGFVLVGAAVQLISGKIESDRRRQLVLSGFVSYVVFVSFLAGASQRDLWPFAAWALMVGDAPSEIGDDPSAARIMGVDSMGREHRIDFRAWQPLSADELRAFVRLRLPQLTDGQKDQVGAWLFRQAEEGRAQARRGREPGYFHRILGPFSAPAHLLHPARWNHAADVPDLPFIGVRIYRDYFTLEERRRNPSAVRSVLVYEFEGP